jgi:hypothetical protein
VVKVGLTDKIKLWRDYPIILHQRAYSSWREGNELEGDLYDMDAVNGPLLEGIVAGCILGYLLKDQGFFTAFTAGAITVPATMAARGAQYVLHIRRCSSTEELYGKTHEQEQI